MKTRLVLLAIVTLHAAGAFAADMPKRKPGLWLIDTKIANAPAGLGAVKQCIDASTDNLYQQMGEAQQKDKCPVVDVKPGSDKTVVHSVCKFGNTTATTDAVFTGRFDADYRGDINVKYEPPMQGMSEAKMSITAKWLGPCEAGMKPGDMILPNGMKFNPQQMQGKR